MPAPQKNKLPPLPPTEEQHLPPGFHSRDLIIKCKMFRVDGTFQEMMIDLREDTLAKPSTRLQKFFKDAYLESMRFWLDETSPSK